MNTEEAHRVLGLSEGATRSEVKKAYRKKQKKMERQVGVATTAINKQISLQELSQLDESKQLLMPREDETQEVRQPGKNTIKLSSYLSTTAAVLVLVIVGLSITTGKIAGVWDGGSTGSFLSGADANRSSGAVATIITHRKQAQMLRDQYAQVLNVGRLQPSKQVQRLNTRLLKAISQEEQGASSVALINYRDVIAGYQALLSQIQPAIEQKQLAEKAHNSWNEYRQKNAVALISEFDVLLSQKEAADKHLQAGAYPQAKEHYETFANKTDSLLTQLKATLNIKQDTLRAQSQWHSYRKQNNLGGEKIEVIEQAFILAEQQQSQGLLQEALKSYQQATTDYKIALADGSKHVYEKMWLAKMRKRLAEIEAEQPSSGPSPINSVNTPKPAVPVTPDSKPGAMQGSQNSQSEIGRDAGAAGAEQQLAERQN